MEFKIKGENKKLVFGVRFVALLDESEKYEKEGFQFGMGLLMAQQKIEMGSMATLAKIIRYALIKENYTLDEIYDALDDYAAENDMEIFIEKIEHELKNSNAVRAAQARMSKQTTEANRKQAAQKPTTA